LGCHASHISRGLKVWGVETLMALVQAESDPSWSYSIKALGVFAALASLGQFNLYKINVA